MHHRFERRDERVIDQVSRERKADQRGNVAQQERQPPVVGNEAQRAQEDASLHVHDRAHTPRA